MLFSEPPPSPGDLHFSIFGFDVRVHPFFWLVSFILGHNAGSLRYVLLWMAAVFAAILVHELGHAVLMRRLGLRPWIVLYGMGGLACYDSSQLYRSRAADWLPQIWISLAGPGAGFLLASVVAALVLITGGELVLRVAWTEGPVRFPYFFSVFAGGITSPVLDALANDLLWICVTWGLVNLLPIYPLDGGQVAREIFTRINAQEGIRRSLILSVVAAGLLAAWALSNVAQTARLAMAAGDSPAAIFSDTSLYVALLLGYLAFASFQALSAYGGPRRYR